MTSDQFDISGRVAIVTGASSGIGRAIAERFAHEGADVVICSRDQDNVDPVAAAINESADAPNGAADADHGAALAIECDVTDRDAVDALIEAAIERFGPVDTLVNNAGASFMANFEDISPNGWGTIVDINLTGTYHCSQAVIPVMKDAGGGAIVNLSSVAGQQGSPYMSHYGAAKAGVINLTTTLAYELAGDDIRVNCIAPGFVATPGVESQMGVTADEIDRETVDRRIGHPAEIADIAQFLVSPAASYVVGETITACGTPDVLETP